MTIEDRIALHTVLSKLSTAYGPWAVLWEVVQVLRVEFERIESKRGRK